MKKINTLLAIIIASVTSMNTAAAQGTNKVEYEYYKIVVVAPEIKIPEEVIINGIVKDETGKPLANAKVKSDFGEELLTDNNGAFSFTLKKERVAAQNIYVGYENLVTAVRSYHPSMVNTTYDITLYKPAVCCNIKKCEGVTFNAISIYFNSNSNDLNEVTKKQLDSIANSLKECPTANIRLTLYTGTRKSMQKFTATQLNAIKNYLIEQNGITGNRIKTDEVIDKTGSNRVDITPE